MRIIFGGLLLLAAVLSLTACDSLFGRNGYFRNRGDDYLDAKEIPPMTVPQGMDRSAISELFVIPPVANEYVEADAEYVVPRSSYNAEQEKAQVKIQKLDQRRWILINSNPSLVWPRVKFFLEENGLKIASENPASGQIETTWLLLKNETGTKDRYRLLVEQGLHSNMTEIHVLQVTVSSSAPGVGDINWPTQSSNVDRERWMVERLAAYLASAEPATASLVAQSIGRSQKVSFVQPYEGESFILILLDPDRVYASVGGALNKLPFQLKDVRRDIGVIDANYDPEYHPNSEVKESPGFFSRLFGFGTDESADKNFIAYQVKIELNGPQEAKVFVRDSRGDLLPSAERDKILQKIRQQLL